jgi:hypothetical protein
LDGLTHLSHYSDGTPYPPAKAPTAPSGTLDAKNGTLKAFYKLIQGLITKPGTLLVLDDISVLLYNGFEARQVSIFIQMLKTLVSSVDGTLITVMHADEEGSEDAEQDGFVRSVLYQSEVVFQVQALNSGLAKDVHGQLDILRGPKYTKALGVQPQSVHYKILDNGVHFFAKGVSQGVL